MQETKGRQKEIKTHTFTVEMTFAELDELEQLKARGRKVGHFVREAIVEKLARERRDKLGAVR